MVVHLLDGTYELFRHEAVVPEHRVGGRHVGAVRAVCRSVMGLLEGGATHLGVATDHVIESFRNDLWPGYKTGAGLPERLTGQFEPLERSLAALGVTVWPMVEMEADDALASAAALAAADPSVERVMIMTPDKDLAQCVRDGRVVTHDRRSGADLDTEGVRAKFGVPPAAIPDLLALVGDSADGFPGLRGWGAKSSAALLSRYGSIEGIPDDPAEWDVAVRGAARLGGVLAAERPTAMLFKRLATLREDADVLPGGVEDLRWRGPAGDVDAAMAAIDAVPLAARARALAADRDVS
jgi:5'-3' exonuclease